MSLRPPSWQPAMPEAATELEAADPILTMPDAPPAFHVMAKPTGAQCNLDCAYTTVHAANGEQGREV